MEGLVVSVRLCDCVVLREPVMLRVPVLDELWDKLGVADCDAVRVPVLVSVGLCDCDFVAVCDCEGVAVCVCEADNV